MGGLQTLHESRASSSDVWGPEGVVVGQEPPAGISLESVVPINGGRHAMHNPPRRAMSEEYLMGSASSSGWGLPQLDNAFAGMQLDPSGRGNTGYMSNRNDAQLRAAQGYAQQQHKPQQQQAHYHYAQAQAQAQLRHPRPRRPEYPPQQQQPLTPPQPPQFRPPFASASRNGFGSGGSFESLRPPPPQQQQPQTSPATTAWSNSSVSLAGASALDLPRATSSGSRPLVFDPYQHQQQQPAGINDYRDYDDGSSSLGTLQVPDGSRGGHPRAAFPHSAPVSPFRRGGSMNSAGAFAVRGAGGRARSVVAALCGAANWERLTLLTFLFLTPQRAE